jgi:hypothetical protein
MTKDEIIAREASKSGMRGKINAKCCECIYDGSGGAGGNWRQQVTACTSYSCPLYPVRPVSKSD